MMSAYMSIETIPSLKLLLAKVTRISRRLDVRLDMFLHVLPCAIIVSADMTHVSSLQASTYQVLYLLVNLAMVSAPSFISVHLHHARLVVALLPLVLSIVFIPFLSSIRLEMIFLCRKGVAGLRSSLVRLWLRLHGYNYFLDIVIISGGGSRPLGWRHRVSHSGSGSRRGFG